MLKPSILAGLTVKQYDNGMWLVHTYKSGRTKQVIKVGACEPLYIQEYANVYRYGPYVRMVDVYRTS